MRLSHWEAFKPACPACTLRGDHQPGSLMLAGTSIENAGSLAQGVIACEKTSCGALFPIIDGLPILVGNLQEYLSAYLPLILRRDDLDTAVEALLDDMLVPGSPYDLNRQYLSSYAWDSYGEFDDDSDPAQQAGSLVEVLSGFPDAEVAPAGPVLDVGCATGRSTFEAARQAKDHLVLGVDLNFSLIQLAQAALQRGVVEFPLRRVGLIYESCRIEVPFQGMPNVDFWVLDACRLPLPQAAFSRVLAINVLDAVAEPSALLAALGRVLRQDGAIRLSTPFEWSMDVTPMPFWLGGKPAAVDADSPVSAVKAALDQMPTDALTIEWERDGVEWRTRITDRTRTHYSSWLAVLRKVAVT